MLDTPIYYTKGTHDNVLRIVSAKFHIDDENYFCVDDRIYQIPVPLSVRDYYSIYFGYCFVTPKIDGTRRFLILFNGQCFSIDPLGDVRKESLGLEYLKSSHCVLDCEYVPTSGIYNVIDVVCDGGEYVGDNVNPITRIGTFSREYLVGCDRARPKEYRRTTKNVYSNVLEWKDTIDMDGIVVAGREYSDRCYKIKFDVTIDLYVDGELGMRSSDGVPMKDNI